MGDTRTARLTALGLVTGLVLTGCSVFGGEDDPGPAPTAESFASALSSGRLARVGYVDQSGRQVQQGYDEIVAGMGDVAVDVRVLGTTQNEDGTGATATLAHTWELGEKDWSYETTLRLSKGPERWLVDFAPSAVAPQLRQGEILDATELSPERGDVLGAGGVRLVTDRPVARFGIDKTQVEPRQAARSARQLADLLEVDAGSFAGRVEAAGDEAFVEALVLRTEDVSPRLEREYPSIPGARALGDEIPLAPTREFARPVLGTVGPVTAEVIEESDGEYEVGDEVGLSGLQQRYQDQLAGSPGLVVTAERDETSRELFRAAPADGEPLRTTLDVDLQRAAENALAAVGPASALVAIRPSDGQVLAAASGPGSDNYSTATLGRYAPGSTFKVVSSLALLRAGLSPQSPLRCPETLTVDGKSFKNYDDYPAAGLGRIDLRTALANSCNTAFIGARDQAPQEALAEAAAALGLGVERASESLGFAAYLGSVPTSGTETGHAASMIGQGQVLASPLAMATVAASVSQGATVTPRLVVDQPVEDVASGQPLTAAEAEQLRRMMRAVVDGGSASFLADVPGPPVLAKTGTAEFGTEVPLQTHAWMIAVHGDLAVAAFVEVGESGSQTAGPLLEEFLRDVR